MSESHKEPSERKEVVRKLKEKKKELGKSPSQGDVSSSLAYAARKHFGSWNAAKEKAGLETSKPVDEGGENWSRKKVISELRKLATKLDRPPVMADDFRLAAVAQEYFGSWNRAKEEAGLEAFNPGNPGGRNWSRERVISELQKLADDLGRSPVMADNPGLASAARRYFGSWNAAKEEAGLETFSPGKEKWSKEKIVAELKKLADELGKSPSQREASDSLVYAAKKLFGSWNAAKKKAGLETFNFKEKEWSKEKIVTELKELDDELGRSPVETDDLSLAGAAINYFGSWNAAKEEAGLETFKVSRWSKEKIVKKLRELAEKLGRSPTLSDDPGLAQAAWYHFGSWNAAKEKAGLRTFEPRKGGGKSWSKEEVIDELKKLADELGKSPSQGDAGDSLVYAARKLFGSWNAAKKKAGLETFNFKEKEWSKEKIVTELKELADELGRSPIMADDKKLASAAKYHFGSWNAAKKEAGLKTFSRGFPCDCDRAKRRSRENEKVEMVRLSIKISNLASSDEIEPLARKLAQLKGVGVGKQPWKVHPSNLVDWAKSKARSILRQYPEYYLQIQDGWAEKTFNKIKMGKELEPDTQSSRPDSTSEVKA